MFEQADWTHRDECIAKHDVTPEQANEALADPHRVVINPDPAQRPGGRGVRIIDFSTTSQAILTVIVVEDEGTVHGASAWKSNATDIRRYEEKNTDV